MTLFQFSYLLLWALAIVLVPVAVILVYLLAQLESLHRREGSGYGNNLIGRKFPAFSAIDAVTGEMRPVAEFSGQTYVVLLVSPGCNTCRSLIAELTAMTSRKLAQTRVLVLCMGDQGRCTDELRDIRTVPVFAHGEKIEATADLWLAGFPAALVVDDSGMVVDVRHPLSIKGVVSAIENATVSDRYRKSRVQDVAPTRVGTAG